MHGNMNVKLTTPRSCDKYCFIMLCYSVNVVLTNVGNMVSKPLECYSSVFVVFLAVHHIG